MENMDKRKIAAIVATIIVFCVVIFVCCSKIEYDENGNIIEITSEEESTETTSTYYTEETTEDLIRPTEPASETTTDASFMPDENYNAYDKYVTGGAGYYSNASSKIVGTDSIDQYIAVDGGQLKVGVSMDDIKAVLGEPMKILTSLPEPNAEPETNQNGEPVTEPTTAAKVLVEGGTDSHRYRNFKIDTKVENGVEIVKNIEVITDKVKNLSGKDIMNKEAYDISLIYGEPTNINGGIYEYKIDDKSYLYFKFSGGKVSQWGIASR